MNYDPIHDTFVAPDSSNPNMDDLQALPDSLAPVVPSLSSPKQLTQPPASLDLKTLHTPLTGELLVALDHLSPAEEKPTIGSDRTCGPTTTSSDGTDSPADVVEPGMLPPNFRQVSRGFKHLKKADGEPFWRKDIQYEFLHELFTDDHAVFTNSFPYCEVPNAANGPKLTFAQLYVRTLAESLKSSKVLRERLIKDTDMAIAVSKVCLLVNAGRMNTTVNFVPDMRLALRTYHLIPSLQIDAQGQTKALQDTPRLKTILKAVCEGQDHLQTLFDLLREPPTSRPNTNVIKLIFMMSTFFQNIPFHYDDSYDHDLFLEKLRFIKASPGPQNKFMEFFLNDEIDPKNRAQRFLWLVYTYLETGFTQEEFQSNPFHPMVIPPLQYVPEAEVANYDLDRDYEVEYAIKMYHTRMLHLQDDVGTIPKRTTKVKRERPKVVRKPLVSEELKIQGPVRDIEADELMVDDTLQGGEGESTDEPEQQEDPRPSYIQKYVADRAKRKKPTPSVGSLVDDNKKPLDGDMRWSNPEFPIAGLAGVLKRFSACTTDVEVQPLTRDNVTSTAKRRVIANKSRGYISQVAKVTPDFAQRRQEYLEWMYRYFQYKKATGNGLLGMEWENLRSDLINGVEAYLYQQNGKMLVNRHYDEQMEDERSENGEPELLKRENFVTGSDTLPGDSAPIDIGSIDKVGSGYVAVHDFDNANERTRYEYLLMALVDDVLRKRGLFRQSSPNRVSFDLEKGTMTI